MAKSIITLGREGVITDTHKKVDWIMSCFFFSLHSQSRLFKGNISSLPKVIQRNTDAPGNLKNDLEETLTKYLNKFFPTVIVNVDIEDINNNDFVIALDADITDSAGAKPNVSIGYSLTYRSSRLEQLLDKYTGRDLLIKQP